MTQFNTVSNTTSRHTTAKPETGSKALLTRRQLLYGAAGLGAVAAVGIGVGAYSAATGGQQSDIPYLKVPNNSVTKLTEFEALEEYDNIVQAIGDVELPYGTLLWMNDDSVAACLLPTDSGSPLTQVQLLHLGSMSTTDALEQAVGTEDHFDIYDVRATEKGLVWTEANVLKGVWRIYTASLKGETVGTPTMLEEGDSTYATPSIAAVGDRAFWQVIPKDVTNPDKIPSRLMAATFGQSEGSCIYESARRMGTPIYASENSVTITPRIDTPGVYYQLTNINATSGEVVDQLTLPNAMTPLEAGYGNTGFMFSFADIYNYGDGISNLGTYLPMSQPNGDYDNAKWFSFARTPTAAPAWCNDLLIVKSTLSVCGVNLKDGTYFAIDVDDGAESYGDYLASSGSHKTFLTYTNIDYVPVEGDSTHACRVKLWTTVK